MRILAIVHEADAGPGVFADAVAAAGHQLEVWQPTQGGGVPEVTAYGAVLTLGGGMHPDQEGAHPWLSEEKLLLAHILERETPLLAVCLGAELLAEAAGGAVRRASIPEIGWYPVLTTPAAAEDPLLAVLPPRFEALEWHSYECLLPPGAMSAAASETCLQAYRAGPRAWGIQFHAEVTLETFESWLDTYHADPDAVELGIDPTRLRRRTRGAIEGWNRIGYDLCRRFLELADRVQRSNPG